ncbi:MAG TPA: anthranilate phosphoribosyltransferase [Pseudonocardiaceae bacterium]
MSTQTWPAMLGSLIAARDLTEDDTAWAMDQIMSGVATTAQIAGFAVALRAKGETSDEIAGMARTMLAHAKRVSLDIRAVDLVGTGGDQAGTVNISTMAAVVTAAAGIPVVKHGARAASSKCGAADVLEALGVAVDLQPEAVRTCVTEVGIGFCFAPVFHPAMRYTAEARGQLGVPTVFNFLGPLTNPAQPPAGLVGCANPTIAPVLAQVFAHRGTTALVVRGDDGLDELTTTTTSTVWVADGGSVRVEQVNPADLGVRPAAAADLVGGDKTVNAQVMRDLLGGRAGPVRDAVLLNAAGAVVAFRGLSDRGLTADLLAAMEIVGNAVDSGAAASLLDRWAARTTELRKTA